MKEHETRWLHNLRRDTTSEGDKRLTAAGRLRLPAVSPHRLLGALVLRLEIDPMASVFGINKFEDPARERTHRAKGVKGRVLGENEDRCDKRSWLHHRPLSTRISLTC